MYQGPPIAPPTMPPLEDDDDEISSEREVSLLEPERYITMDDNFATEYRDVVLKETINGEEVIVLASIIGCKIPTRAIQLLETVYQKNRDLLEHGYNPKYPSAKILAEVNELLFRLEAMANEEDHHQYPNLERKLFFRIPLFERDVWIYLKQAHEFRRLMEKFLTSTITDEETKRFDRLSQSMAETSKTARPIMHREKTKPVTVLDDDAAEKLIGLESELGWEEELKTPLGQEWQEETTQIIRELRDVFRKILKEDPEFQEKGSGGPVLSLISDHDAIYGIGGNNRYTVNDRAEICIISSQCRTTDIETVLEKAITYGFTIT